MSIRVFHTKVMLNYFVAKVTGYKETIILVRWNIILKKRMGRLQALIRKYQSFYSKIKQDPITTLTVLIMVLHHKKFIYIRVFLIICISTIKSYRYQYHIESLDFPMIAHHDSSYYQL